MQINRLGSCLLFIFAATCGLASAEPPGLDESEGNDVNVCPLLHAKAVPAGFQVPVMEFTGPAGDGRRGSAGFVVQSKDLISGNGTQWKFVFQRDPSGFGLQVIHPFKDGHVLVNVHPGVTIHRGGEWGHIGWGNPNSSDKVSLEKNSTVLPLDVNRPYQISSQLTDQGEYQLTIDGKVVCRHLIKESEPLSLRISPEAKIWGGSSWDRTTFAGPNVKPDLVPGHAGLIISAMDGSGPRHFVKDIILSPSVNQPSQIDTESIDTNITALLEHTDDAREFGRLKKSKTLGGSRGGYFEIFPDKPSVLVGFDYTTSRLYGGHLTIKSLCPVFRDNDGQFVGQCSGRPHGKVGRVEAKPGYVVAGMIAKSGHRLDGMRLIFMRVRNGRLNPDDTYRSDWIGGKGGGRETVCAANGDPIVGIFGKRGHDIDSIGFIQVGAVNETPYAPKPVDVVPAAPVGS